MTNLIADHLIISSPSEITQEKVWSKLGKDYLSVAQAFKFRRSREINDSANQELLDGMDEQDIEIWHRKDAVFSVRDFLERLWVPSEDEANASTIAARGEMNIKDYPWPAAEGETEILLVCPELDGDNNIIPIDVEPGSTIAIANDPDSKNTFYFLLGTYREEKLSESSFAGGTDSYQDAWLKRVDTVKRVFPKEEMNHSVHEYLDLSVSAIIERFPFLHKQLKVTEQVRDKLTDRVNEETNYNIIQALFQEIKDLNLEVASIQRAISSLAGYATSKGYILITDQSQKIKVTIQGQPTEKTDMTPGTLLQQYRYVSRWIEEKKINRSRKRLFRSTKRWVETIKIQRSAVDIGFKEISGTDSLISDYIQTNLQKYNPVILYGVSEGFQATDGRSLESIISLCEMDAEFQKKCVLLMPVYDQTLFGEDIISGYHIIKRPNKGRRIVSLPEFFMEENISYKLRWLGFELGELLSSINLLPGEERNISVSTKRSSFREGELKSTQSFEDESSTSLDTVSSIENEFQKENSSEKTSSWSVKASGSYGGFSGGASKSGTSKKTARQFAKSLNKLTTQAVSKLRKRSRKEIVARELTREEAESTFTSSGQITNPNVGRTLNVNYFSINNIYVSSTYLEDIGFTYISPFELIDGTGIREVKSYSKEDLGVFLRDVEDDITLVVESGLRFSDPTFDLVKRQNQAEKIAKEYINTLKADFAKAFHDYSSDNVADVKGIISSEKEPVSAFKLNSDTGVMRAINLDTDNKLETLVSNLVATDEAIEPSVIISPSAAVYSDAYVGETEALETYAVDMRKLEVEKQLNDIHLSQTSSFYKNSPKKTIHQNVAHFRTSEKSIMVRIGGSIESGKWKLIIGGHIVADIEVSDGEIEYEVTLNETTISDAQLDQMPGTLIKYA